MADNIPTANFALEKLQPSDGAPAAYAAIAQSQQRAGAEISGDFSKVGSEIDANISQAKAYKSQTELQNAAVDFATNDLQFATGWEKALATGDPGVQQAFLDQENEQTDAISAKYQSTPEGKAYSLKAAADQKLQHFHTVSADQTNQAGAQASAKVTVFSTTQVGLAGVHPEQLPQILANIASTVPQMVPAGPGTDAVSRSAQLADYVQKASQAASNAALKAEINRNPQAVLNEWNNGDPNSRYAKAAVAGTLDANDFNGIPDMAQTEIAQQQNKKDAAGLTQAQEDRATYDKLTTGAISAAVQSDGTMKIDANFFDRLKPSGDIGQAAAKIPGGAQEIATLQQFGVKVNADKLNNTPAATDDATYGRMKSAIVSGQLKGEQGKAAVLDQFNKGGLSQATVNELISSIDAQDTAATKSKLPAAFVDGERANVLSFTPQLSPADLKNGDETTPIGKRILAARKQAYDSAIYAALNYGYAAGKTDDTMLNPASPDYIVPGVRQQLGYDPSPAMGNQSSLPAASSGPTAATSTDLNYRASHPVTANGTIPGF